MAIYKSYKYSDSIITAMRCNCDDTAMKLICKIFIVNVDLTFT